MKQYERVFEAALKLLADAPEGIRYSVLRKTLISLLPDIPENTVHGSLYKLCSNLPADVYQPSRGLYRHVKYHGAKEVPVEAAVAKPQPKLAEEHFYSQFAEWLVSELEECTKAIPLGGNVFKDKWGTPDVIGIREPRKSDIIKAGTEGVAAEIKTDGQALIVAFGQACAYKIFAHRSYIVVPNDSLEEDIARLDALARIFGIGLILFDRKAAQAEFEIRVRAARNEPDMFYVNKYMKLIEDELFA